MSSPVIPIIVEQHAEEAAFLWILRHAAIDAPHYRLKDLAKLDNRIEAHLDGLRIAGAEGWRFCEEGLKFGEAGEVFAAAVLALESRDSDKLEQVTAVVDQSEESMTGLVSAFGWVAPERLSGTVKRLLASPSSFHRRIAVAACAVHRVNPGAALDAAVRDPETPVQLKARVLRAAGELRRRDLLHEVRGHLRAGDESIRAWASWAATLLGDRGEGLNYLKMLASSGSGYRDPALRLVLRAMDKQAARNWLKGLAQYPDRLRDVVSGLGIVGDPSCVPWLVKQMETAELARAAGESFSLITGVDIAYEDLDGERPEAFESGPTENPEDDDVAMDQDEDLPWPDPKKIRAWWEVNQSRFPSAVRHLAGAPISLAQCRKVLLEGYQRQRAAAALELALLKLDAPLFEVRAPGWRQQRLLRPSN
jgi:uncharacterized protein (TIGR02270 family)